MSRASERGLTFLEVVVAVAMFAVLLLVLDVTFSVASKAAHRVEHAADIQQNARLAIELLTREVRESSPAPIAVGGSPGAMAIVFKSARLAADASVFCLFVPTRGDPLYRSGCFYWSGAPVPPYTGDPPYAPPCNTASGEPCGTYAPIWQRAIGYYVAGPAASRELRRTVVALSSPDAPLPDPATLRGGQAVASYLERFDVAVSAGAVTATLSARAAAGGAAAPQTVLLTGVVQVRHVW